MAILHDQPPGPPPPLPCPWQTHRDCRRRALRQLYQLRQISSAQYRLLLETVIACASLMETNNQMALTMISATIR